jgi:Tol biopolymer transport system component
VKEIMTTRFYSRILLTALLFSAALVLIGLLVGQLFRREVPLLTYSAQGRYNNQFALYLHDVGQNRSYLLERSAGLSLNIEWAPDGRAGVLTRGSSRNQMTWTLVERHGRPRGLIAEFSPGTLVYPIWSPDSSKIAYMLRDDSGGRLRLFTVDIPPEGRPQPPIEVTSHRLHQHWRFTWSPDSRQIAYSVGGSLHLVDLDSGEEWLLIEEAYAEVIPEWSPDGREIGYILRPLSMTESMEIHVLDLASGESRLLGELEPPAALAWSRDSRLLAYRVVENDPAGGEFLISWKVIDRSGNKQPIEETDVVLSDSSWSPDGRFFSRLAGITSGNVHVELVYTRRWQPYQIIQVEDGYSIFNANWKP